MQSTALRDAGSSGRGHGGSPRSRRVVCAEPLSPLLCGCAAHVRTHSQASTLKAAGVDKVVCVTVGDPKEVQQWAASNGFDKAAMVSI